MEKRSVADQVKGGFRLTGLIFYFLGIAGLFVAGVAYAFFPTGHSRALGWIFLAVSIPIMLVEINRWAKVLPGILGLAVLNGLISVSTGHVLANPTMPISRINALILTAFFAGSSVLSGSIARRKLNWVDRVAWMVFLFSFVCMAAFDGARIPRGNSAEQLNADELVAMGIALGALGFAWLYDRVRRRRDAAKRRGRMRARQSESTD